MSCIGKTQSANKINDKCQHQQPQKNALPTCWCFFMPGEKSPGQSREPADPDEPRHSKSKCREKAYISVKIQWKARVVQISFLPEVVQEPACQKLQAGAGNQRHHKHKDSALLKPMQKGIEEHCPTAVHRKPRSIEEATIPEMTFHNIVKQDFPEPAAYGTQKKVEDVLISKSHDSIVFVRVCIFHHKDSMCNRTKDMPKVTVCVSLKGEKYQKAFSCNNDG